MSTGSLEMESAESVEEETTIQVQENDMTGWWEPRIKVNLADQLPGNTVCDSRIFELYHNVMCSFRKYIPGCPTRSIPVPWC